MFGYSSIHSRFSSVLERHPSSSCGINVLSHPRVFINKTVHAPFLLVKFPSYRVVRKIGEFTAEVKSVVDERRVLRPEEEKTPSEVHIVPRKWPGFADKRIHCAIPMRALDTRLSS